MATVGGRKFLFDPTWASGHIDKRVYVRKYVEQYWMTEPELMLFNHLPEDDADQLMPTAITRKQFEDMTYFRPSFFFTGMSPHSATARVGREREGGREGGRRVIIGA